MFSLHAVMHSSFIKALVCLNVKWKAVANLPLSASRLVKDSFGLRKISAAYSVV